MKGNKFDFSKKVQESFIFYFDILGYKERIKEMGEEFFLGLLSLIFDEIISKKIEDGMYTINIFGSTVDYVKKFDIKYKIFSDNVVMSLKLENDFQLDFELFISFMNFVGSIQNVLLLLLRTYIRGSFAKGSMYIDENFVFGNGLISAYEKEDKMAIYPRIVLDSYCRDLLVRYEKQKLSKVELYNDIVDNIAIRGEDGIYFINYLFRNFTLNYNDLVGKEGLYALSTLKWHKVVLEDSMENESNERILQKYHWCANFHNQICEKYNLKDMIIYY